MSAPELDITQHDGRFALRLRVSPGARKPGLAGVHGGALKVRVSEPPEGGRANAAVAALLAGALGLASRDIEITSGLASRDKRVLIRGFAGTAAELKRRLQS